jgi:predicted restriction endonuclease
MLKASHIKPWKDSDNKERLDKFNGLLLSAHLDSAFDNGLISFTDTGEIIISPSFTEAEHFSIDPSMKLKQVFEENKPYLSYHRKNIFQGTP